MAVKTFQVAIVGGGMVGATLACLLAEEGVSVALIDAGDPAKTWPEGSYDLRVSALTLTSVKLLKSLGVWADIDRLGQQSMQKMFVWDHFASGELLIDSADAGEVDMGSVVENRVTVTALWHKLQTLDSAHLFTSTQLLDFESHDDGVDIQLSDQQIKVELLVGADGVNSKIRKLSNIDDYGWDYQQKALVATVQPEKPHQKTAWQRFLPEGPLALLPLRDGLVSIVWSSKTETTEDLLNLSEVEFCRALYEASEQQLGEFKLIGARAAFPLKMQFSTEYCQQRMVLIGDAIHAIHPLAGQGANLGLKDAASLAGVILQAKKRGREISSQQVLRRYERQRKADNLLMMGVMDAFKHLFTADQTAIQLIRSTGMSLVNKSTALKKQICRYAMGLNG
mgnify:CR=1 FL=1